MAIIRAREPVRGREIVHAALRRTIREDHPVPLLRNFGQTGAPLPIYRIGPTGIAHPHPITRAKKIGWRYPIVNGGSPGLACLLQKSDCLEFSGVSDGQFPERLFDAAAVAEEQLGHLERKFQPRLLEIPSLRLYLLWLFSPRRESRFIPLTDAGSPNFPSLHTMSDIEALMRDASAAKGNRQSGRLAKQRKPV